MYQILYFSSQTINKSQVIRLFHQKTWVGWESIIIFSQKVQFRVSGNSVSGLQYYGKVFIQIHSNQKIHETCDPYQEGSCEVNVLIALYHAEQTLLIVLTLVNTLIKCNSIVIADGNISEVILCTCYRQSACLTFVTSAFNIYLLVPHEDCK